MHKSLILNYLFSRLHCLLHKLSHVRDMGKENPLIRAILSLNSCREMQEVSFDYGNCVCFPNMNAISKQGSPIFFKNCSNFQFSNCNTYY